MQRCTSSPVSRAALIASSPSTGPILGGCAAGARLREPGSRTCRGPARWRSLLRRQLVSQCSISSSLVLDRMLPAWGLTHPMRPRVRTELALPGHSSSATGSPRARPCSRASSGDLAAPHRRRPTCPSRDEQARPGRGERPDHERGEGERGALRLPAPGPLGLRGYPRDQRPLRRRGRHRRLRARSQRRPRRGRSRRGERRVRRAARRRRASTGPGLHALLVRELLHLAEQGMSRAQDLVEAVRHEC